MKLANRLLKIDELQMIRMAKLSRELNSQGKDIIKSTPALAPNRMV